MSQTLIRRLSRGFQKESVSAAIGKVCPVCKEAKPLSSFKKVNSKSTTLSIFRDQCISCEDSFKQRRVKNQ